MSETDVLLGVWLERLLTENGKESCRTYRTLEFLDVRYLSTTRIQVKENLNLAEKKGFLSDIQISRKATAYGYQKKEK